MSQKRVPVGFPPHIDKILEEKLAGLGNTKAERVKNIVIIYLTERGYLR